MAYEFKVRRLVEFSETDMAGIVHFTNFFRYMEQAEHAFYRELGMSVMMTDDANAGRTISWPRISARCDYKRPLRFEDEFEIHLLVRKKNAKSLNLRFVFCKVSSAQGREGGASENEGAELVAIGELAVVCVSKDNDGSMTSIEIPPHIADRIDEAPAELFEEDQL